MNTPDKIFVGITDGKHYSIVGEGYPNAKMYVSGEAVMKRQMHDVSITMMRDKIEREMKRTSDMAYSYGDAWGVSLEQDKLYSEAKGLQKALDIIDKFYSFTNENGEIMIDIEQKIMEDMVIKPQQALIKLDKKKKEFNEAFHKLVAKRGSASFEDVYKELGWEYPFKKNVPASPESLEETVDEAKDKAMKDIAWKVHCLISEGKSIAEIDHYVCGICDF